MPAKSIFPLTVRLVATRLRTSVFTLSVASVLPAFLVFLGVRDSPRTAMKLFLLFYPYVFLIAAQDMLGSELRGGGLENVLFLREKFKTYLWQKNLALAVGAGIYAAGVFTLLAAWGLVRGTFDPFWVLQFGLGLLAGFYYIGLAGALSHFLKTGSNVVVILLAQAACVIGLLLSATSRTGFIDCLASGRFPDLKSRLLFLGFTSVFPNQIVSRRLAGGGFAVAVSLALVLLVQRARTRRLELPR